SCVRGIRFPVCLTSDLPHTHALVGPIGPLSHRIKRRFRKGAWSAQKGRVLMAGVSRGKIKKRTWTWQGKKRTAWYFDVISNGERVRRQYPSQTEAETELDAYREEQRNPKPVESQPRPMVTLAQAIERYLAAKARKRTVAEDKRQFEALKTVF